MESNVMIEEKLSETDRDYLDCMYKEEQEERMIRNVALEEMMENGFEVIVKRLKTGKIILSVIADQITTDQEFDMDTGFDIMVMKMVLNENYVAENGDPEFMGEIE